MNSQIARTIEARRQNIIVFSGGVHGLLKIENGYCTLPALFNDNGKIISNPSYDLVLGKIGEYRKGCLLLPELKKVVDEVLTKYPHAMEYLNCTQENWVNILKYYISVNKLDLISDNRLYDVVCKSEDYDKFTFEEIQEIFKNDDCTTRYFVGMMVLSGDEEMVSQAFYNMINNNCYKSLEIFFTRDFFKKYWFNLSNDIWTEITYGDDPVILEILSDIEIHNFEVVKNKVNNFLVNNKPEMLLAAYCAITKNFTLVEREHNFFEMFTTDCDTLEKFYVIFQDFFNININISPKSKFYTCIKNIVENKSYFDNNIKFIVSKFNDPGFISKISSCDSENVIISLCSHLMKSQ